MLLVLSINEFVVITVVVPIVNRAKDMRERFSMLRWPGSDTTPAATKDAKASQTKPTADSAISWSKSLDNLLSDKCMICGNCYHIDVKYR